MPRRPKDERLLKAFAERLRAVRANTGISQEGMAFLAGISRNHAGQLESAKVTPSLDTIVRVAAALGCDPGELVQGLRPSGAQSP